MNDGDIIELSIDAIPVDHISLDTEALGIMDWIGKEVSEEAPRCAWCGEEFILFIASAQWTHACFSKERLTKRDQQIG